MFLLRRSFTSNPSSLLASSSRFYHGRVIDHYENPRNVGRLSGPSPSTVLFSFFAHLPLYFPSPLVWTKLQMMSEQDWLVPLLVGMWWNSKSKFCFSVASLLFSSLRSSTKVDPATQRITETKFKTFGCGSAIASSSYATEMIKGKTLGLQITFSPWPPSVFLLILLIFHSFLFPLMISFFLRSFIPSLFCLLPSDECLEIKNSDIAKHLSLPPVKLHCSMLAEDAIKAAIADYKKKNST